MTRPSFASGKIEAVEFDSPPRHCRPNQRKGVILAILRPPSAHIAVQRTGRGGPIRPIPRGIIYPRGVFPLAMAVVRFMDI